MHLAYAAEFFCAKFVSETPFLNFVVLTKMKMFLGIFPPKPLLVFGEGAVYLLVKVDAARSRSPQFVVASSGRELA